MRGEGAGGADGGYEERWDGGGGVTVEHLGGGVGVLIWCVVAALLGSARYEFAMWLLWLFLYGRDALVSLGKMFGVDPFILLRG